jgi:membrane protein YdbS with pleckstrin-like domain
MSGICTWCGYDANVLEKVHSLNDKKGREMKYFDIAWMVTILLIVLKVANVITISWAAASSPIWIGLIMVIVFYFMLIIFSFTMDWLDDRKHR